MNRCGERRWLNCLLGVIFLIVLLMETVAFADSGWFKCAVNLSGPGRNETFIQLTDLAEDPVFITKWFRFSLARSREMLAVALSAINSDRNVVVVVDPDSEAYPVVSEIYLCGK